MLDFLTISLPRCLISPHSDDSWLLFSFYAPLIMATVYFFFFPKIQEILVKTLPFFLGWLAVLECWEMDWMGSIVAGNWHLIRIFVAEIPEAIMWIIFLLLIPFILGFGTRKLWNQHLGRAEKEGTTL